MIPHFISLCADSCLAVFRLVQYSLGDTVIWMLKRSMQEIEITLFWATNDKTANLAHPAAIFWPILLCPQKDFIGFKFLIDFWNPWFKEVWITLSNVRKQIQVFHNFINLPWFAVWIWARWTLRFVKKKMTWGIGRGVVGHAPETTVAAAVGWWVARLAQIVGVQRGVAYLASLSFVL